MSEKLDKTFNDIKLSLNKYLENNMEATITIKLIKYENKIFPQGWNVDVKKLDKEIK